VTLNKDAIPVAKRIRKATSKMKIPGQESLPSGKISSSIGLATFPDDALEADGLLATALTALYQAKAEGRDCVVHHGLSESNPEPEQNRHFSLAE